MKEFTLTKEEFIQRSMKGEVFIDIAGDRYFYDKSKVDPFRFNDTALQSFWSRFNGKVLFTLEQPKPIIERRWIWLKDYTDGTTTNSAYYISDKYAEENNYPIKGWYKSEMFIDVEVKQCEK